MRRNRKVEGCSRTTRARTIEINKNVEEEETRCPVYTGHAQGCSERGAPAATLTTYAIADERGAREIRLRYDLGKLEAGARGRRGQTRTQETSGLGTPV